MENKNYRAYFIVNMYMSGIHAGIQAAHCLQEINNRFSQHDAMLQWGHFDKTMIILNGGNQKSLQGVHDIFMENAGIKYPYGVFREDHDSLNCAMTAVGIIIPEKIYLSQPDDVQEQEMFLSGKHLDPDYTYFDGEDLYTLTREEKNIRLSLKQFKLKEG